ncbi:hypothetical protein D050_2717 [Vibrio parahaemolyticus VPCR-2009]|nr:hypothetical protein D050_2717 [Vibrio parahaemolyticus VPCR-2009]
MKRAITSRDNKKAFEVYISKLKRFFYQNSEWQTPIFGIEN